MAAAAGDALKRRKRAEGAKALALNVRVVPAEVREAAAGSAVGAFGSRRRMNTKAELMADHTEEAPREREDLKAGASLAPSIEPPESRQPPPVQQPMGLRRTLATVVLYLNPSPARPIKARTAFRETHTFVHTSPRLCCLSLLRVLRPPPPPLTLPSCVPRPAV